MWRVGLRDGRIWLAALAASLLAFALQMVRGFLYLHFVWPAATQWGPLPTWTLHLVNDALYIALTEAAKLAALWWVLRRDTGRWFALGLAFGVLAGAWDLLRWGLDWWRAPAGWFEVTPWVVLIPLSPVLLYGVLGLLAQGLARRPGQAWWGWAGASLAGFILVQGIGYATLLLPSDLDPLHTRLLPQVSWLLLGWAAWRVGRHGARALVVMGLGATGVLVLALAVLRLVLPTSGRTLLDVPTVLLVAAGICVLSGLIARRILLPWVRDGATARGEG